MAGPHGWRNHPDKRGGGNINAGDFMIPHPSACWARLIIDISYKWPNAPLEVHFGGVGGGGK